MFSKRWWLKTTERAVKTAAQIFLGAVGADKFGWIDIDWATVGTYAGVGALLSIATSIATTPLGSDKDDPSLV